MLRHTLRILTAGGAAALALAAAPALAHENHDGPPPPPPGWDAPRHHTMGPPPEARMAWLSECRSRISRRDDGVGGALIGGAIGGLAGNRIGGRHHRTEGTIAGAAVGAIAGAAIDRAEDRGARDECERYLDEYYGYHSAHARHYAGYYAGGMVYAQGCCQPVMTMPRPAPECREEVRYVTEYVTVPGRRVIPRRPAPRDKRVRIVPDKRIRTN